MSGKVGPLSRLYNKIIGTADIYVPTKMRPFWEHAAGEKRILTNSPNLNAYFFFMHKVRKRYSFGRHWANGYFYRSNSLYIYSNLRQFQVLVLAGIGDINRPAHLLSINQCSILAMTGLIWSRYSLVIVPKNYSLFSVNVFVALTQLYQVARAVRYQRSLKDKPE